MFQHELFLIENGTVELESDTDSVVAEKGMAIFHPQGSYQRIFVSSREGARFIWIHFAGRISRECFDSSFESILAKKVRDRLRMPRFIYIPPFFNPAGFWELSTLGYMLGDKQVCFGAEKSLLITVLIAKLAMRFLQSGTSTATGKTRRLAENIRKWIDSCTENKILAREISAHSIAEHFQMNADYLNRLFKRFLGVTISGYINHNKLERAKRYLMQGTSVKQAAYLCGFSNPNNFSTTFKKYYKAAPSMLRHRV